MDGWVGQISPVRMLLTSPPYSRGYMDTVHMSEVAQYLQNLKNIFATSVYHTWLSGRNAPIAREN